MVVTLHHHGAARLSKYRSGGCGLVSEVDGLPIQCQLRSTCSSSAIV
jgi:hypothetical protein